ncbi:DUF3592 domain-containing protein [Mariniblastus sp.]|nr:DUF3592 domain-containing protein [Mariniblastus sp.]
MSSKTEQSSAIIKLLLFAIFLTFCWSVSVAVKQTRMKYWPITQATITEFSPGITPASGAQQWCANPKIRYAYQVGSDNFEAATLNPSPLNYQRFSQLQSDTGGIHEGSVVECWYDPSSPRVAYLVNRGVTIDIWIILALTGFYTLNAVRVYALKRFTEQPRIAG